MKKLLRYGWPVLPSLLLQVAILLILTPTTWTLVGYLGIDVMTALGCYAHYRWCKKFNAEIDEIRRRHLGRNP